MISLCCALRKSATEKVRNLKKSQPQVDGVGSLRQGVFSGNLEKTPLAPPPPPSILLSQSLMFYNGTCVLVVFKNSYKFAALRRWPNNCWCSVGFKRLFNWDRMSNIRHKGSSPLITLWVGCFLEPGISSIPEKLWWLRGREDAKLLHPKAQWGASDDREGPPEGMFLHAWRNPVPVLFLGLAVWPKNQNLHGVPQCLSSVLSTMCLWSWWRLHSPNGAPAFWGL